MSVALFLLYEQTMVNLKFLGKDNHLLPQSEKEAGSFFYLHWKFTWLETIGAGGKIRNVYTKFFTKNFSAILIETDPIKHSDSKVKNLFSASIAKFKVLGK